MRHKYYRCKLGRTGSHRSAMMANMMSGLIKHRKIQTTISKAKFLRPRIEKLVTMARSKDLATYRRIISILKNVESAKKLQDIAEEFRERNGGYTRIMRIGNRKGDNSEIALIEFV